jgi:hypothetical protein
MIQKIKTLLIIGAASLGLLAPGLLVPLVSGVASADIENSICSGADAASQATTGTCTETTGTGTTGIEAIAKSVTNIFSVIVGAVSIIMIIYGGFRYIVSGGDSGKVGNAKNTLIYALVGLIIVALAQLIVRFVLTQAVTTTNGNL